MVFPKFFSSSKEPSRAFIVSVGVGMSLAGFLLPGFFPGTLY